MLKRIFAILVICCLTISAPLDVLAEELAADTSEMEMASAAPVPEEPEPTETPAPAEVTAVEAPAATESPAPTEAVPTETPAATESPAPTENPIDTTKDASHSPAFEIGYAEVLESEAEALTEEDERFLLPKGLIVYVSDRTSDDRLEFWIDMPDGLLSGWTAAKNLRPLSEAETAAFAEKESKRENVRFVDKEQKLPLALSEKIIFPDAEAEPVVPPADAAPTEAPSEEDAEQPSDEAPAAISIDLEKAELSVCAGDSFVLLPHFSDGNMHDYTVVSSDEAVLQTKEDGRFSALAVGTSTLTFRSEYGDAFCSVEVAAAPTELTVRVSENSMYVGETAAIHLENIGVDLLTVAYSSSDESVAVVDSDGRITAIAAGECIITAEAYNGAVGSAAISVYAEPTILTLSEDSVVVRVDKTFALTAQTDSGSADDVVWTSSDESVAVCEAGKITCVGVGECEIKATLFNLSAVCRVTVKAAPEAVTLPYSALKIGVGESVQLKPDVGDALTEFSYASSKSKYATVSSSGVIKGVRTGTAKIRVRTDNGKEVIITVNVCKAPSKVTASPATLTLGVGETGMISYTLPKNTAGSATFTSNNTGIAVVDPSGVVTAVAPGTAKIRVQTYNKKNAYVTVEVRNAPESVSIFPDNLTIGVGQIVSLSAAVNSGAAGKITLASADESLLAVSGNKIKGLAAGTAEVLATSYNGVVGKASVTILPAPEKVTLPYKTLSIGIGEYVQLMPDCGDTVGGFSYASSSKYVKVFNDGLICGVKRGTSTITVSTYNGKKASVTVKVYNAPSKVTASPATLTLGVGETGTISYTLPKNTMGSAAFTSNNSAIAAVDPSSGVVTAVAPGTAKIRVQTYNKKNAYVTVEVKNAPESVSVSPEHLTVGVGQIVSLAAAVNSGAAGKITFASADESLLAVSGNKIKGLAAGTAEVLATSYNGVVGKASVTIAPAPEKVTLPYKTLNIGVGESFRLTPDAGEGITGFTYRSNATKYVKVDSNGVIKGLRAGSAKVYVRTYNGKETYVTVKVCTAPKSIKASITKMELGAGQTGRIGYLLPTGTASAVTYSSSNPEIASVDAKTGAVTALAPGDAVITLRTFNGKTAQCAVRVYNAPDSISVNAQNMEMGVGQTFQLQPVIPENSRTFITYSTSDSDVATVSSDGKIIAVGKGAATVRVQTHIAEVFADVQIEVGDAPTSVSVAESQMKILLGNTFQIEPIIPEGSKSPFAFISSNPDVATVAVDGTVTTLDVGRTTITISTYNGKTAAIDLKVWHPSYPETITLLNAPDVVNLKDGSYALECAVEPETAAENIQWVSANPKVASVDENGVIQLHNYGYAVISAVSTKNSSVAASFTLAVQMENLTLTIPKRTTQEDGIEENLALIDNIRTSAIAQVNALEEGGVISASDASKRRSIINNIFADYAFPWKTPSYQVYWKEANSEGGAKDFKPDRVYYGLPYISSSGGNNRFNAARALSQNRYVDSGKGYYLLNRNNLLNGKYVGNDCSALVDAAIWGTGSSHMFDNTADIATSSFYKTIKNPTQMRPGDLLCKSSRHVVMFLYYANPEKTKIMIIENGGEEAGTNTVHCAVHDLSYYTELEYKVRRLKSLG